MAGIQTAIQLNDRITAPLQGIMNALNMTVSSFEAVNNASENAIDTSNFDNIRNEINQANSALNEFAQENENARKHQEDLNRKMDEAKPITSNLTNQLLGLVGAYVSFNAIVGTVKEAIEYASDLTEVQNVVDVTFADSAETINEWSKTTMEAYGLSELAAKQYSGTMGAMLKSMGLTGGAVDEMSMNLTQLAGDMASFYNLDNDMAFEKIRSGISGETEPLKQLGINMSVANLEAYALSQGIETAYKDMDAGSQALLRYNYLLSVTSDAQGDFSRTGDSYANQVRKLEGNWQSFTGTLATSVLPLLTLGVSELNNTITFIQDNWSVIEPILAGILAIVGLYTTALIVLNTVKAVSGFMASVHAAALALESGKTITATAAQYGFNAALLACPITWIIVLIIALIAAIIAVAQHIANMGGTATTWFGVICGGVSVVGAFFKNLGLEIANIAVGIGSAIGAVCSNIGTAFHNVICDVQSWWCDLLSTVLNVVAGICEALNKIPFVEFDYSGLTSAADDYANKAAEATGNKEEYTSISDAFNSGISTFDTFQDGWVSDAYNAGAAWGDGVSNNVSNAIDGFMNPDLSSYTNDLGGSYTTGQATLDDIKAATDGTEKNTKKTVDVSDEQIKYLRDIAEQEAINRFTTAEIKVDMTNNNNISSGMDLDGIIESLNTGVKDAMSAAAEGVH